jgi:sulfur relay (sulfurtransferase) complex TusBCD TusD component (DsrE family)
MQSDTLVSFTRNGMGHADPDLQLKLAGVWLTMCLENDRVPGAITFYTDGVRLACEGSPVLDQLNTLEEKGVHLILCKTCVDTFGLSDKVAVGILGGMGDIFAAQTQAAKVIAL